MKNSWSVDLIPLFITYVVVKSVHWLAGFNYDIFNEGILNIKFLVDVFSWGGIYAIVYILLKTFIPKNKNSV
jgi:hypothetical protein